MLNRRNAPPLVVLLLVVFAAPVLVDVEPLAALRYALWTALWWGFGWALVGRYTTGGFERATIGAAVGIGAQLANWLLWQVVGAPSFTVAGGVVALVAAGVLERRARNRTTLLSGDEHDVDDERVGQHEAAVRGIPTGSLWLLTVATFWMAWLFVGFGRHQSRPPGPSTMYQDLYWHVGIAAELKRAALPTVPHVEVLGQLNYHWLSNAYMASGSLGSFTSTSDVATRLWYLPVVALALALCLVVGRRLSGAWIAGTAAIVLFVIPAGMVPMAWKGPTGPTTAFVWPSPSQIFGLVFTLWAAWLFVPILRGARIGWKGAIVCLVTAFVCAGAKSSILPVFCCGALAVGVVYVRRSAVRRGAAIVFGSCLAGIALALPLFAGGSAGSKIRLFSSFRHQSPYKHYVEPPNTFDHGPFVMPHLETTGVVVLVVGLLVALAVQYGYAATSVALGRTWRTDPAPVFLLASFAASLAAYLLVDHTGMSQGYFPMGALPLIALLAGWGFAELWERSASRRWQMLSVGFVIGGLLLLALRWASGTSVPDRTDIPASVLAFALLTLALVVGALVVSRYRPLVGAGILFGAALVFPAFNVGKNNGGSLFSTVTDDKAWTVSAQETSAAQWVRDHSGETDVVATNVHCRVPEDAECDSRAYWVSALTERRVFIEAWGYTDPAQRNAGRGGLPATSQPFSDQKLFALNEKVFHDPDGATVEQLQRRGVRWLYADTAASDVSPDLADYADAVHHSGTVTVYRLD